MNRELFWSIAGFCNPLDRNKIATFSRYLLNENIFEVFFRVIVKVNKNKYCYEITVFQCFQRKTHSQCMDKWGMALNRMIAQHSTHCNYYIYSTNRPTRSVWGRAVTVTRNASILCFVEFHEFTCQIQIILSRSLSCRTPSPNSKVSSYFFVFFLCYCSFDRSISNVRLVGSRLEVNTKYMDAETPETRKISCHRRQSKYTYAKCANLFNAWRNLKKKMYCKANEYCLI